MDAPDAVGQVWYDNVTTKTGDEVHLRILCGPYSLQAQCGAKVVHVLRRTADYGEAMSNVTCAHCNPTEVLPWDVRGREGVE
jgi:hypothetical protein